MRWQGNSKFEEDHNKRFPYDLMFNAVKNFDVEFISLQRDEGSEACPPWVKRVPLDSWIDTQNAVASCDMVISACTSVSHLSAAMGIETLVVIPCMGYYLYALDGSEVPYYNSMRLFRQKTFSEWSDPFNEVKEYLSTVLPANELRMVS